MKQKSPAGKTRRGFFIARIILLCLAVLPGRDVHAADVVPQHMIDTWYHFKRPGPFYRMDMNFTWERGPKNEHIYEGFFFEFAAYGKTRGRNRAQGYMGPQIYFKKKRVLFSIWNAADGATTAVSVAGHCSSFTGEGDGVHCDAPYEWVQGREYRLTVERAAEDADGEEWLGSISDVKTGAKTEIGRIKLMNVFGFKGYGGLDDAAGTFTEYVHDRPRTCASQPYVRMRWSGPYIDNGAVAAVISKSIYPKGCVNSNATSPGKPVLIHEAGENVTRTNKTNVDVWR